MASSASFETPLTVNDNPQNNYHCQPKLPLKFGSASKQCEEKKSVKNNTNRKVSGVRRTSQKQDNVQYGHQSHKANKRRYTFTGPSDHKLPFKRRRRGNSIVLPTKFLLGGNINDPLNLQSLADEEINRRLNEATPKSSPVPTPKHRTQVQVLIPPNINDPLNLNTGEDIEFSLISPKYKKRKRTKRKKDKQECSNKPEIDYDDDVIETVHTREEDKKLDFSIKIDTEEIKTHQTSNSVSEERVLDKIVSPVVPQGSPTKFHRRFHSKCTSKDTLEAEKSGSATKSFRKKHRRFRKGPQRIRGTHFREKDAHFRFGNCVRYFGLHIQDIEDPRLRCLRKEWFENKTVLDIGCNAGHVTLHVAKDFTPKKIVGIDIDEKLIKAARYNVNHYCNVELSKDKDFPVSMGLCFGPLSALVLPKREVEATRFPNNVVFLQDNYVLESDDLLETQQPEFDTILCLSLTKWVHLNYGDDGVKRVFRRIHAQLNYGGHLILEAQNWPSYKLKKRLTQTTYKNYYTIQLKPDKFNDYLLSNEVGFSTCEMIGRPPHPTKGFRRPIFLFTKGVKSPSEQALELHSPDHLEYHDESQVEQDPELHSVDEIECINCTGENDEISIENNCLLVGERLQNFSNFEGIEESSSESNNSYVEDAVITDTLGSGESEDMKN